MEMLVYFTTSKGDLDIACIGMNIITCGIAIEYRGKREARMMYF